MGELKYRSLRGMPDIVPEEAAIVRWIEGKAREVFTSFGYGEIRTPLLEETEVFTRSIGADTDIVEKEMYSFSDRGGKSIALRPEGTASIIRAYIENGWGSIADVVKLYYIGPMFRGERPQKGRLRQFSQIGAEIIGGSDPYIDAELILCLDGFLKTIGLDGYTILLNSLGCVADRKAYTKELAGYLSEKEEGLCEDCVRRSKGNVLRVLDCKNKGCKSVVSDAPGILGHLCEKCIEDYGRLKEILSAAGVPFKEKSDLVRGLDYYTGTIFEVVHPSLGAQDAIAAGGRYDNLSKEMGGPDAGATGYAVGVERLIMAVDKDKIPEAVPGALVVHMGGSTREEAFSMTQKLRAEGVACDTDLTGRSFKGQMRKADREKRKHVVLIGEDEIKSGKFTLKDMEKGEQEKLAFEEIVDRLKKEQG